MRPEKIPAGIFLAKKNCFAIFLWSGHALTCQLCEAEAQELQKVVAEALK